MRRSIATHTTSAWWTIAACSWRRRIRATVLACRATETYTGSASPWPTRQRSWRAPSRRRQARTLLGCLRHSRPQAAAAGRRSCEMRTRTPTAAPLVALAALATTSLVAQAPPSVDELLVRVGERIAEYYK